MKYILFLFQFCILFNLHGQFIEIKCKKYFNVKSYILQDTLSVEVGFNISGKIVKLSKNDVEIVEKIIKDNSPRCIYKYYKKNSRKYIGYQTENFQKRCLVLIQNSVRYPEMFPDIESTIVLGFGDFYENPKNQKRILINLVNKEIIN
ncbi:MAG: hypothetical protein V4683_07890 [Bacteroidota bacterium]